MSELLNALDAAETDGDNADATPEAPQPAAESTPQTPESETPAQAGEADFLGDKFDWNTVPAELLPLAKQLQGDYTRKTQSLAEQRKQIEGFDPGSLQWLSQVNQLARTHPAIAAQMLEAEAQRFRGDNPAPPQQAQQPQIPEQEMEYYVSDGERHLAQQITELKRIAQQQERQLQLAAIEAETAQLERKFGLTLDQEQRNALYNFCAQNRLPTLELGWKAMDYDRATQRGRDQAAKVVQQKQGMGAQPQGVPTREAEVAREPKSLREALEADMEASGM